MRKIFSELSGITLAGVVFCLTGILFLPVVAMAWPINVSGGDLPLKPQHLPCMGLGFVLALYTFRRFTARRLQRATVTQ